LTALDPAQLERDSRRSTARGEGRRRARERLQHEATRRGRKLLRRILAQTSALDDDELHRIRIGARRLRYIAEAIAALSARPSASAAPDPFKAVQDELGEIHDAEVLAQW